jgi:putative peptide zinc metalloprotease protein
VSRLLRRLLTLIAVVVVAAAAPAHAQSGGDNAAVAVNTKDGSTLFKVAFDIRRTMQEVVDNQNAAVAYASCEECRTVAIAFQIVLVMGDVESLTPTNIAVAINEGCTLCDTAAFAYQFVVGTSGVVRFTGEGQQRLSDIARRLRELEDAGLTDDQLAAELDLLADEVRDVLANELVAVGPPEEDGDEAEHAEPEPTAEPPPEETPTPTPTPTATETPSPEPTATTTP